MKIKDWHIIKDGSDFMIQHIPSGEYLGGKCTLTSSKNINNKKNWRLQCKEDAMKKLKFVAQ